LKNVEFVQGAAEQIPRDRRYDLICSFDCVHDMVDALATLRVYCSAKSGFIPRLNGGAFTPALDLQLRQTMRNLLDNLEQAGLTFKDAVSTNVYLDDLSDFQAMKERYAKYFGAIFPARTTI
jgi:enamine deaminase RidA (YjgF/YER057c/UK114 family)